MNGLICCAALTGAVSLVLGAGIAAGQTAPTAVIDYSAQKLVAEGEASPRIDGATSAPIPFDQILSRNVAVGPDGRVYIAASLTGQTSIDDGLFVYTGTSGSELISESGLLDPADPALGEIGTGPWDRGFTITPTGDVLYYGTREIGPAQRVEFLGRIDAATGVVSVLAEVGDAADDGTAGTFGVIDGFIRSTLEYPPVDGAGGTAFRADVLDSVSGLTFDGVFRVNDSGMTREFFEGDTVPVEPPAGTGSVAIGDNPNFLYAALNAAGDLAVEARGQNLLLSVRSGIPGLPVVIGQTFVSFYTPDPEDDIDPITSIVDTKSAVVPLFPDGSVAAYLNVNQPSFEPSEDGVYRVAPGSVPTPLQLNSLPFASSTVIASDAGVLDNSRQVNNAGDLAFSALEGVALIRGSDRVMLGERDTLLDPADPSRGMYWGNLDRFALNDLGQVAFSTELLDGNGDRRDAVFFYGPNIGLRELAREGATVGGVELASTGFVRLHGADEADYVPPEADGLGDDGTVAFTAKAATGEEVVFTWHPGPSACSPADLTTTGATLAGQMGFGQPDGSVDLDDLGYFLGFFLVSDPVADVTTTGATLAGQPGFGVPDGVIDLDDLGYFLGVWLAGCL
ncbi:MAG: GC-type dockerin domain-anchored protein [Planctomycetota bacterium]